MEQEAEDIQTLVSEILRVHDVTIACAHDMIYLRTRRRWTPELEVELIKLHQNGTPPNIMEFGISEESQNSMKELIESVENSIN